MNADDLIEKGLIRDTDLEGAPPEPPPAELGPFGRYTLLEELGRGGSGIVYRALDPLLNRELALKRHRFSDFEMEARFLREAELLARLSHAGIMPVFDFGREGDSHYFTMPLAAGLSLDKWIEERRPDARESARIVRQAAEALAHAHDRGVLHRDVKPANILVSGDGNALVADFGLGRIEDPKAREGGRMTQSGEVMGTPNYMAPEFALGDLKGVDQRCDVYGLGATLYEALTGRPPFVGRTSLEILKLVTTEEPAPPRKLAPHTPVDLEIICLKALEKDPARRYATSRELADDLGRFLAGEPIRARRAGALYRIRRFVGRRRGIVAVALAGILAAGGVTLYAVLKEETVSARRRRAADHLDKATRHATTLDGLLRTRPETDPAVETQARLAHAEIDKALDAEPRNAEAFYLRGRVHSLRLEYDSARQSYDLAIKLGPVGRAVLERAIMDCQELVRLKMQGEVSTLARAAEIQVALRSRLEHLRRIKTDPVDLEFGAALMALARFEPQGTQKAAELLASYTDHHPDWRAFYWRGVAETLSMDYKGARASFEKAREDRRNGKAAALILDNLGFVLVHLDMTQDAEDTLRRAAEMDPALFGPKVNLASVLMELDRTDEALDWCGRAIADKPSSPQAHAIRGQCLVVKHKGLKPPRGPEGAKMIQAARESLEIARSAYGPGSPQWIELEEDWKHVLKASER